MCGRFALTASEDTLIQHFKLVQGFNMVSRYNIAPSQVIPIIKNTPAQLEFARWGFIPGWSKSENGLPHGHINARAETIEDKPTFKQAFKRRRCLIPASGYFEWMTVKGKKQPYYITVNNQPLFAFAGIWETWSGENHDQIETCAILTTDATEDLRRIHDRMPLIFMPENYTHWLNPKTKLEKIKSLLTPPSRDFLIRPVSTRVNNPKFDDPSGLESLTHDS